MTSDALSRLATVTDNRGVTTACIYDGYGRVVEATYTKSDSTAQTIRWTYGLSGN